MEDERTDTVNGKMPVFARTLDEARAALDCKPPADGKVERPGSDLSPDGEAAVRALGDRREEVGDGERRGDNNNNNTPGRRASAVEILRRNFGTISRKPPSPGQRHERADRYSTEETRVQQDSIGTCTAQRTHSDKSQRYATGGAEIRNERRFNLTRRLTAPDVQQVVIRTESGATTHSCVSNGDDLGSCESSRVKEHVYCTVYCIAADTRARDAEIPAPESPGVPDPQEGAEQEVELEPGQDADSSPRPYTLQDLVDPSAPSGLPGGEGGVGLLGCRVCLEDKPIAPLHCCRKPVCDECLKLYVSSQVRVGRADIRCPIPECRGFLEEGVILSHLANEEVGKYHYFLELSQLDASTKPCPNCSLFTSLKSSNPRTEHKYKIQCSQCQFPWCFRCHAPWHAGLRCGQYRRGDRLLRHWASAVVHGQRNAQRCPKCKIHIQRTEGCDHMTCSQCNTNFCYRCGERYRHLRFFGDHTSNLSVFGCRYRYLPDRPHLRRLVRGSVCASKVLIAPLVIVLVVVLGALSLVLGLVVFPIYYICKSRRKQRSQGSGRWI